MMTTAPQLDATDDPPDRLTGLLARGMRISDQLQRARDAAREIDDLSGYDARAAALHLACRHRRTRRGYTEWLR